MPDSTTWRKDIKARVIDAEATPTKLTLWYQKLTGAAQRELCVQASSFLADINCCVICKEPAAAGPTGRTRRPHHWNQCPSISAAQSLYNWHMWFLVVKAIGKGDITGASPQ